MEGGTHVEDADDEVMVESEDVVVERRVLEGSVERREGVESESSVAVSLAVPPVKAGN